jgi:hypothetical protein
MYSLKITTNNKQNIMRFSDNASIPFVPDNTDYQQFKKDLVDGVELQDSTGNAMTQTQITTFLETIP